MGILNGITSFFSGLKQKGDEALADVGYDSQSSSIEGPEFTVSGSPEIDEQKSETDDFNQYGSAYEDNLYSSVGTQFSGGGSSMDSDREKKFDPASYVGNAVNEVANYLDSRGIIGFLSDDEKKDYYDNFSKFGGDTDLARAANWNKAYEDYYSKNYNGMVDDRDAYNSGGDGAGRIDYGTGNIHNIESPYITRDELQRQAEYFGLSNLENWMRESGLWAEDGEEKMNSAIWKKDAMDHGYVPYGSQYVGYNQKLPSVGSSADSQAGRWQTSSVSNALNLVVNDIGNLRNTITDWDVVPSDDENAVVSGKKVDKAIEKAIRQLTEDPGNYNIVANDISLGRLPQDISDQLFNAWSDPFDTTWLLSVDDSENGPVIHAYDGRDFMWEEVEDGVAPYLFDDDYEPSPVYTLPYDGGFTYGSIKEDAILNASVYVDGHKISGKDFARSTKDPTVMADLLSLQGADVTEDSIREMQDNSGQNTDYGWGNISGPDYLEPDLFSGDFARTIANGFLSSVPYFNPVSLAATAAAKTNSHYNGIDPDMISVGKDGSPTTYTPSRDWLTGTITTPIAALGESAIGGVGAVGGKGLINGSLSKLADKSLSEANKLRYSITKDPVSSHMRSASLSGSTSNAKFDPTTGNKVADYFARHLAPEAAAEGVEEVATSPIWELASSGDIDFVYAPGTGEYDEYGREIMQDDVPILDRFGDYLTSPDGFALDFGLGSLLGGGMTGLNDLGNVVRNSRRRY